MRSLIVTALLVLASQFPLNAQDIISVAREKVLFRQGDVVPVAIDLFPISIGTGKAKSKTFTQQNALSMRIHFQIEQPTLTGTWEIRILNAQGKIASKHTSLNIDSKDFWSHEISGNNATVELFTNSVENPDKLKIKIVEIASMVASITPQSITPPNQLESILNQSNNMKLLGKSVARLRFIASNGKAYVCSAFLVSKDLLMTNNHCINTESEMRSCLVDFDFDASSSPTTDRRLRELVITNQALDFSLVRLTNAVDTERSFLKLANRPQTARQTLIIIQHPGGKPKFISRTDCSVVAPQVKGVTEQLTDFNHTCDTEGGSSGSPVLDNAADFNVVGLHHLGFLLGGSGDTYVNRAVRISLILEYIKKEKPILLPELTVVP